MGAVRGGSRQRRMRAADGRGPYVLQAMIAQCHALAADAGATRWDRIVTLYDDLLECAPPPSSS